MIEGYLVNVFDDVAGSELAAANAYRDLVVADGGANLLQYLPLDANYGLTDQSGNGRSGTAVNAPTIGGIAGPGDGMPTATDLDGVNQRVSSTYSPFTNATVRTYEGWANRDTSTTEDTLFGGDVVTVHPALRLSSGSQNVVWNADMSGAATTWAAAWPGNGVWVHWMLVFDEGGDTVKLYINGSLVSSQAHTVAYNAAPGNMEIGARAGATGPFDGKIAHVAVYNTDKSALAAAHYAAPPYAALTGNTAITVADLADFNLDPEGGSLKVDDGTNNETLTYAVPSGSTGSITLGTGLAHSYVAGTKVTILVNGLPLVERWADVREPDGEDLLRALVPHWFRPLIALGSRDEDAGEPEHVNADFENGDLVIQDVLGTPVRNHDIDLVSGQTGAQRFVRGSTPLGQTQAQLGVSNKNLLAVQISDDALASAALVQLTAPAAGSPPSAYKVSVNSGGTAKNLLLGDGTSDYAFADWSNAKATTLVGVLDDLSADITGRVITPSTNTENGIIVRRPSSAYGLPFVYGDAQAFLLIKEGTGSVHSSLVLARIDGRTGAAGFAGGVHSAGGLHKDAGDPTPTQNLWVQNNLDMIGIVVNAFGTSPASSYQVWNDGSGNTKAAVTKDGVLAAYAADATYGSAYVSSPASGNAATLALGRGGASVESTLGVASAANQYLTGSSAGDLVLRTITGALLVGVQGTVVLTANATTLFSGVPLAMSSNKITGLAAGTTGSTDAARMVDIPSGATYFPVFGFGAATGTAPVANTIYFGRINVLNAATLTGIFLWNAGTVSGNAIVALFDSTGTRVALSNSTAVAGTNAVQKIPFTGTYAATTGIYYAAVMFDNATTRYFTTTGSLVPTGSSTNASFVAPGSITAPTAPAATPPVIGTY